jgi:hypothetical protein
MKRFKKFILPWIHGSVFIYLASQVMPGKFVLGTHKLSLLAAIIISGFLVTVLVDVADLFLARIKTIKLNKITKAFAFWIINFVALWIVARIAPYSGFGVVKFTYLIGLAFATNLIQLALKK